MKRKTDGLIIRETPVGEADKFVTILTRDHGVVRAAARGARKVTSRSAGATQLLTHAQISMQQGKNNWYIDDAKPLHVFFELKNDIENLSLAQYFCELAGTLCPREEPAEESLRLLLNALHYLGNGKRPAPLLKAVVEGRLLSEAGYMPNLSSCVRCGAAEGALCFLPAEGQLVCAEHANGLGEPLSPAALAAFRHLLQAPLEQCFAFALPPKDQKQLGTVCEMFLKAQLGRSFATLDFYNTLHT